jgi:hypothetical protein
VRPERHGWGLVAVLSLALTACPGAGALPDGGGGGAGGGGGGGGEVDAGVVDAGVTKSAKANVRFKGDVRFALDLSVGLALPLEQLCNELGQYACLGVHAVALQGVDAYGKGLFEPVPVTGSTAPIVVDRMVTSACLRRVELDLGAPRDAVIFRGIPLVGGRLADVKGAPAQQALVSLARRGWLRDPTAAELAHLEQLAVDVAALGGAEPAKQWMQAACFAVFSSEEALFY